MKMKKIKLGRNDICSCDSGKKYKHCCLLTDGSLSKNSLIAPDLIQQSMPSLKNRFEDAMGETYSMHSVDLDIKMSEVILDLADDLLKVAKTKSEHNAAIAITCTSWNLAVLASTEDEELLEISENQIDQELDQDDTLEISENQTDKELYLNDTFKIMSSLIEKKHRLYPNINRLIIDYELVGKKNKFHLSVMSTNSKEELTPVD